MWLRNKKALAYKWWSKMGDPEIVQVTSNECKQMTAVSTVRHNSDLRSSHFVWL